MYGVNDVKLTKIDKTSDLNKLNCKSYAYILGLDSLLLPGFTEYCVISTARFTLKTVKFVDQLVGNEKENDQY